MYTNSEILRTREYILRDEVYNQHGITRGILTLWQKVVERAYVCMYIFMDVCTCPRPRARLWYGTMQRLQVLDSRESTNEHKTCQQPWEDGRVSTELLVRPVFTLYRGSRCGSQGAQTTYQTDRSTRIHFC